MWGKNVGRLWMKKTRWKVMVCFVNKVKWKVIACIVNKIRWKVVVCIVNTLKWKVIVCTVYKMRWKVVCQIRAHCWTHYLKKKKKRGALAWVKTCIGCKCTGGHMHFILTGIFAICWRCIAGNCMLNAC